MGDIGEELGEVAKELGASITVGHDGLKSFGESLELSEPDEERLRQAKELLRRARELYWRDRFPPD